MKTNKFGEIILDRDDLCDLVMQGIDVTDLRSLAVDHTVDLDGLICSIQQPENLLTWTLPEDAAMSVAEFDAKRQQRWFMPDEYKQLDIAELVLTLCTTQEQIQRVGQELLLYQERGLFDLLRYLKYLVDVMRQNKVIWGVGRGSSVASYVLYLLGVHRIDSLHYDLDPTEFLR